MKPVLIVIAGANGAGKTSLTNRIVRHEWSQGCEFINPDNLAQERFGDWNSPENALKAARLAETMRRDLLGERRSMAFETVLSMPDKIEFMREAVECGYFVRFFYIGTSSPAINAGRVAQRMMEGGHTVSLEKIIERYPRSIANCVLGCKIAARGYVYDNSGLPDDERLIFRTKDGQKFKAYEGDLAQARFAWAAPVLANLDHEAAADRPRQACR